VVESTRALRHKNFYRTLDAILTQIDEGSGLESLLTELLAQIGDQVLGEETGITSGRLYRREGKEYVVVRSFGAKGKGILGARVPSSYPILRQLHERRVKYVFTSDPDYDSDIEASLGVENFGAFCLDAEHQYVAAFGIEADAELDEVMFTLNALRYALVHRVKELSFEGQMREAREIQVSLLPPRDPEFAGFEISGTSIPAEEVGGDIYDIFRLSDDLLGIAVGDASGHGLPAALQARDVVTGLRMGVEKDLKLNSVIERLNHVIHRSGLTSRFVSLFFGEIESSGTFAYVNAGHDPGLLLRSDGTQQLLRSTGIVMGPLQSATYHRELVRMVPGDLLLLYTDGIIERNDAAGNEEWGLEGLIAAARAFLASGRPIGELPGAIIELAKSFGGGEPWEDDVTVVALRRAPTAESES
jgi:serine phosphatase RsbU (regulator of sigma subunit)